VTDGQTDKQTDRIAISISRVNMLTRNKNAVDAVKEESCVWFSWPNRSCFWRG